MRRTLWPAIASVLPLLAGCGGTDVTAEPGVRVESVVGEADTTERYSGVVGMAIRQGQYVARCTGVLIAQNLLLTARHCVSPTVSGLVQCGSSPFGMPYPASDVRATTKVVETDDPLDYISGSGVSVVPLGDDECGFDLAAVLLAGPGVPAAVATPFVPRIDLAVQPGELFTAVGYGSNGSGSLGTRRVREGLRVACVGAGCPLSEVQSTEWMGENGGVCRGDSGAPAFDSQGRLIGIVSRGANECDYPIHSELSSRKDWLIALVIEAAALGGYRAPAWAVGAPEKASEARDDDSGCSVRGPSPASPGAAGFLALLVWLLRRCRDRL